MTDGRSPSFGPFGLRTQAARGSDLLTESTIRLAVAPRMPNLLRLSRSVLDYSVAAAGNRTSASGALISYRRWSVRTSRADLRSPGGSVPTDQLVCHRFKLALRKERVVDQRQCVSLTPIGEVA